MNSRKTLTQFISMMLVVLWVYAAMSKLQEVETFREQLLRQPFPGRVAGLLLWLLPLSELAAAGLLLFGRTRGAGMYVSLLLMLLFTGYVGLVLAGAWENVPCACGGIIGRLGWKGHFLFNLFYTVLAGAGVFLWKKNRSRASGGDAASGEAACRSGST